jgi:hypothetical protein
MKVVGISGAQGAGKSTLLMELTERGLAVDQFRVARAVQKTLGWASLDTVMDSPETMMQFQNEVLNCKSANDLALTQSDSNDIILTERTFADIAAYTSSWTWQFIDRADMTFKEGMDFLNPFVGRCADAHARIYSGTLLLPYMSHVSWEDDPNRAKQETVHEVFADIENFVNWKIPSTHARLTITEKTVEARADQVQTFLRSL